MTQDHLDFSTTTATDDAAFVNAKTVEKMQQQKYKTQKIFTLQNEQQLKQQHLFLNHEKEEEEQQKMQQQEQQSTQQQTQQHQIAKAATTTAPATATAAAAALAAVATATNSNTNNGTGITDHFSCYSSNISVSALKSQQNIDATASNDVISLNAVTAAVAATTKKTMNQIVANCQPSENLVVKTIENDLATNRTATIVQNKSIEDLTATTTTNNNSAKILAAQHINSRMSTPSSATISSNDFATTKTTTTPTTTTKNNNNNTKNSDILLHNFQIKKKRYRVLLNCDHIVWEPLDAQKSKQTNNNNTQLKKNNIKEAAIDSEQLSQKAAYGYTTNFVHINEIIRVAKGNTKSATFRNAPTTTPITPTTPIKINSANGIGTATTTATTTRTTTQQTSPFVVGGSSINNKVNGNGNGNININVNSTTNIPSNITNNGTSNKPPTAQYLTIHYAERIVNSPNDCNRWRLRALTLYNSDAYIIRQWYTVINNLLNNSTNGIARLRVQRLLVFINPYGGRKQGLATYERYCKPLFQLAGIDVSCIISQRSNQIRDILLSQDLTLFDAICCVGGDGTVAEVINGLIFRQMCDMGMNMRHPAYIPKPSHPIGIIPAGSTDTVAYSLHGTSDVQTATLHLILGQRRGLDVCSIWNPEGILRFCVSTLSYGYLGDVAAKSEKYRWMGPKRYEYAGVKTFIVNRGYEAEVRIQMEPDDELQTKMLLLKRSMSYPVEMLRDNNAHVVDAATSSSSTNGGNSNETTAAAVCYAGCQRCSVASLNLQQQDFNRSNSNSCDNSNYNIYNDDDDDDDDRPTSSITTLNQMSCVKQTPKRMKGRQMPVEANGYMNNAMQSDEIVEKTTTTTTTTKTMAVLQQSNKLQNITTYNTVDGNDDNDNKVASSDVDINKCDKDFQFNDETQQINVKHNNAPTNCNNSSSSCSNNTSKSDDVNIELRKKYSMQQFVTSSVGDIQMSNNSNNNSNTQWKSIKGKFFMISAANITCACSRSPKGISRFCHIGDGYLDLILVRKTSLINNVRFLINTVGHDGDIRNLPFVEVYRTKKFNFRTTATETRTDDDVADYTTALPFNTSTMTTANASFNSSCQPIVDAYDDYTNNGVVNNTDDDDDDVNDNPNVLAEADTTYSRWNCDGEVVNDLELTMSSHCQLVDVFMRGPYFYNKPLNGRNLRTAKFLNCCGGGN